MKATLIGLLIAGMITLVIMGPLVALLWISWRSVAVGILSVSAVFLFFASVMAAGGTMYNPTHGNPITVVIVGWAVAALCVLAAYWIAGHGIGVKVLSVVAGYFVIAWTVVLFEQMEIAWFVLRHPDELMLTIAQMQAERLQPRARLVLIDSAGRDRSFTPSSRTYLLYATPGTDATNRILKLIADPDLVPYLAFKHDRTVVVADRALADPTDPHVFTPTPKYPLNVKHLPSFYDPRADAFRLNAYAWMTQNLRVPEEDARKIYLRYYNSLP